ncbi:rhomboid family intramembrane serine protease [Spirosoma utsteinense]|uniref:Membrane associated rhomboid family serine protease n=1 Tax=Spirosoma utsteinense TaxID=2585773 RepID=A0ABR6W134_9BACT|nr:rhomboid family intramembrane serine protease [Spirosoma utsteinense]MBC3785065.1 membrane associated rhomboid family serine protease [Spirosoma utsteinense]MBC3790326.1 membrane associated rhomboid family serine protease [Spirosoma utsteinense]
MTVTLIIIVVTAGISLLAWNNPSLMDRWIMNPYKIASRGQYYRLLTSGFLHADWGHLFFNMLSLYFFGGVIEQVFDALFGLMAPLYLIGFYLVGILISDIPSFLKHRNDPGYNSLGASGGVSSILFAAILFSPLNKVCLYFALCVPGFIFGGLYLAYSYYESRRGIGNVNHDAHFYGALFGIVFMIIVYPPVLPNFIDQIAGWRLF